MSADKKKDKRFEKIIVLMKRKFEQRKYYEGQQMLKTLYSRLLNQDKYDQASKLLLEGALILMGHKKVKESIEITQDLVNLWRQHPSDTSFSASRSQLMHELLCMIQGEQQSVRDFMRNLLEWVHELKQEAASKRRDGGELDAKLMAIFKSYALILWNDKAYLKASVALAKTSEVGQMVDLFAEWSQLASSKERPFFVTRIAHRAGICARTAAGGGACQTCTDSTTNHSTNHWNASCYQF